MFLKKDVLAIDLGADYLLYAINNREEAREEIVDDLGILINKNKDKEIRMSYNSSSVKNEIIAIPSIDKKYIKAFIEKEVLKRDTKDLLLEYRYIDDEYILFSSIDKNDLKKYIDLSESGIRSIRTRMDLLLDYCSSQA